MYALVYVFGTMVFVISGILLCFVGVACFAKVPREGNIGITIVGLGMLIIGLGLLKGVFPIPQPALYSEVVKFDRKTSVVNLVAGKEMIVPKKEVAIKFTTDEKKIGKYQYNFGWIKYEPATEDIKKVVIIHNGTVYYISRNGEVKKMRLDFYKKYKE